MIFIFIFDLKIFLCYKLSFGKSERYVCMKKRFTEKTENQYKLQTGRLLSIKINSE